MALFIPMTVSASHRTGRIESNELPPIVEAHVPESVKKKQVSVAVLVPTSRAPCYPYVRLLAQRESKRVASLSSWRASVDNSGYHLS